MGMAKKAINNPRYMHEYVQSSLFGCNRYPILSKPLIIKKLYIILFNAINKKNKTPPLSGMFTPGTKPSSIKSHTIRIALKFIQFIFLSFGRSYHNKNAGK